MLLLAMTLESHVFAQSVSIPLMPGWTWISYPSTDTLDFATALGSFTPSIGDVIESQYDYSEYVEGGWLGGAQQFYPGCGYLYYSNRTTPVIVTFNVQPAAPEVTVTTAVPTSITTTSAVCGGTVTLGMGNHIFARGVCWGMERMPNINGNHISNGVEIGDFSDTLTGLTPGTTYYVRAYVVTDYGLAYGEELSFTTENDGGGHAYVDLGLPSGLLWATCNVGADTPEDYGDYFAWGETQPKAVYDWSTYQHCNGSHNTLTKYCNNTSYGNGGYTDDLTTLLPEDDAATANWGEGWRMPTKAEWQELYTNTTCTWTLQNGVYGRLFTAANGNSIFLPAAGYRSGGSMSDVGSYGNYWSGSLYTDNARSAWYLNYDAGYCAMDFYYYRSNGQTVRPVHEGEAPEPISFYGTGLSFRTKAVSWDWYKMFYSPFSQPESNDRTHIAWDEQLAWNVGDVIKVFNQDANNYDFTVTTIGEQAAFHDEEATFEVTEPEKIAFLKDMETPASYAAFYPQAQYNSADNTVSMTIPSVQSCNNAPYEYGSFTTNTYPMFGVNAAANHFGFHSHAGVLQFNFCALPNRYVKVKQIVVSKSGAELVGTMTYPYDYPFTAYDPNADAYTTSACDTIVVLNCGEGVELESPVYTNKFQMVLLRGALNEGFNVTVIGDKDNPDNPLDTIQNVMLLQTSCRFDNDLFEAEKIYTMPHIYLPVPGEGK